MSRMWINEELRWTGTPLEPLLVMAASRAILSCRAGNSRSGSRTPTWWL